MTTLNPSVKKPKPNEAHDIQLDVRDSYTNDGIWVNVDGSNGGHYSYCYSGPKKDGHNGKGDITYDTAGGIGNIKITLIADRNRYELRGSNCVEFKDDSKAQLSVESQKKHSLTIVDACTEEVNAYYAITVTDMKANDATVRCDPRIINRPPAMA